MGWRPGAGLPPAGFQGEGILGVELEGEGARVWFGDVPSIRLERLPDRLLVSSNGPVRERAGTDLPSTLAAVGDELAIPGVPTIGAGWCSWSCCFTDVTEADVRDTLSVADRLELPLEIVQIDDGYQAGIGDWLDVAPRFGSLRGAIEAIRASGRRAGLWTAPFLVGERSELAQSHPDWLLPDADAGTNWEQRLAVLDVTQPAVAEHLEHVYSTLRDLGVGYHKLDFLYAGAIGGIERYQEGLRIIRRGAGDDAILVGCGAPLLLSVGLVDAMRVGPDVLPVPPGEPDLEHPIRVTSARRWMNGRLWVNDPDTLVARPGLPGRERWAKHLMGYGGLRFTSDRLGDLDERGLELTRGVLTAD
jgi:alpha-galactosidase